MFVISTGAKPKVITLVPHATAKNVAIATMADGAKALVSLNPNKGYFTVNAAGQLQPTFLSATDELLPGYSVSKVGVDPWITKDNQASSLL